MTELPTVSTITPHEDVPDKSERTILAKIQDINNHVAQFRYLLIKIGQSDDGPELRESIRNLRRNCVNACKDASKHILPRLQTETETGIPVDCPYLLLLFYVMQLFLRELTKSSKLIEKLPMDMTAYYESRSGPLSKIVFCKQMAPDFNQGELDSIVKDSREMRTLIDALQEFMPHRNTNIERYAALCDNGNRGSRANTARRTEYWKRHGESSKVRSAFRFLCCASRPNYI